MSIFRTLFNAFWAFLCMVPLVYFNKIGDDASLLLGVIFFVGLELRAGQREINERLKNNNMFLEREERDEEVA